MTLETILLGFLQTPASGYDLKKAFDETVRHFWQAELSQIYPALHSLRRQGLVSVRKEPSERGPDRKVYDRTPAGTEALRRSLTTEPAVENQRIGYLAQLFFLGQIDDPDRTRAFLQGLRSEFARRLEGLRAIEAVHRRDATGRPEGLTRETPHPWLTLLFGLRRTAASVAWCDECLEILAGLGDGEVKP